MARILCTWELGGALGHMSGLARLAEGFRRRGHELSFALRDLSAAEQVFGAECPDTFLQAPVLPARSVRTSRNPVSYAEILQCYGYLEPSVLRYLVKAWQGLLRLARPDLVLFDYSPTALLASRGADYRRMTVGQGFFSPPVEAPLPPFIRAGSIAPAQLREAEQRVLAVINQVAETECLPRLETLGELFEVDHTALTTLPELDPYPSRRGGEYHGIAADGLEGVQPVWLDTGAPRVFGYLNRSYQGLEALLDLLSRERVDACLCIVDIPEPLLQRYRGSTLRISRRLYAMPATLASCDLVINHASHGTVGATLLAGRPQLLIPLQVEQSMLARRVVELGAGLAIAPADTPELIAGKLRALRDEPRFRQEAASIAARHGHLSGQHTIQRIVERAEALLEGRAA